MLYQLGKTSIISLSFIIDAKPKNHGSESNKNILYWIKISIHLAGQRMDSLDHKDLTIAELVPTRYMDVTSLKHTTVHVFTPELTSQEPMPKSCLPR